MESTYSPHGHPINGGFFSSLPTPKYTLKRRQVVAGIEVRQIVLIRATDHRQPFSDFNGLVIFTVTFGNGVVYERRAAN